MFFRMLSSNLRSQSEKWYTVGIMPITLAIQSSFLDESGRSWTLHFFHRFLYLLFSHLIRASFHGSIVNGVTSFPLLGIIVADQPEELSLLCLKIRDSYTDYSHCVLPSRLRTSANTQDPTCQGNSPDDSVVRQPFRSVSISNKSGQFTNFIYRERDPSVTVRHQFLMAAHHRQRKLS